MPRVTIDMSKGLHFDHEYKSIPDGALWSGYHFRQDQEGIVEKRNGFQYATSDHPSTAFTQDVNGVFNYDISGTLRTFVGQAAYLDYFDDGGAIVNIGSGIGAGGLGVNSIWHFAPFGNVLLAAKKGVALYKIVSPYTALAAVGGSPPIPNNGIATFQRHVVMFGDTTYTKRVSWSDIDDYETWTPASDNEAGSYDLYDSSTDVMCGQILGDYLVVYTKSCIYMFQYIGGVYVFQTRLIKRDLGIAGPRCLATANNMQFFLGNDTKFYAFDGAQTYHIGDPIDEYFQANATGLPDNVSYLEKYCIAVPVPALKEIWWCVPLSGSGYANTIWMFNYGNNTWSYQIDHDAERYMSACCNEYCQVPFLGTAAGNFVVRSDLDEYNWWDGDAITWYLYSKEFDMENLYSYKTITQVTPELAGTTDAEITVQIRYKNKVDEDWSTSAQTFTLEDSDKLDFRVTARIFQIRITSANEDEIVKCGKVHVDYIDAGAR